MTVQPFSSDKQDIKAVVIDIDGTLLNSSHTLGERNKAVIKRALDAGITVILATGKTRYAAESIIDELKLTAPGVFVQGLMVFNADGSVRHQKTLDPKLVRRIVTFVEQSGFAVMLYSGNRLLIKNDDEQLNAITKYGEPYPEAVGPLENLLDTTPVHKIIAFGPQKRLKALRWQLTQQTGGDIAMTTAAVLNTLEILPKGISKGRTVQKLLQELDIDPAATLAIGDGENDIELIKLAGVGVAVGNADDRLKDVADEVVGTNDEDGVAEAIERFVLGTSETDAEDDNDEPETDAASETETETEAASEGAEDA